MHTQQLLYYRFVARFVDAVTTHALTRELHSSRRNRSQPPVLRPSRGWEAPASLPKAA